MNQKILLSIAPLFWPKMPPVGIGYLESFLFNKGVHADILDLNNIFYSLASPELKRKWLESCNRSLEENIFSIIQNDFRKEYDFFLNKILQYDIAGFSCFKSNLKTTLEIAKILKSRKPSIKIILGGPEITRQYFKTSGRFNAEIKNLTDSLVVGEGELNMVPRTKTRFGAWHQLKNLSTLPFPKYTGLNLKDYPMHNSIPLLFSRGCIRKCSFCSERLLYKNFRIRPVENLIEEILYHKTQNKIEYFIFHDSMLNADLKKLEELCYAIIKNFGSIKWEAQIAIRNDMSKTLLEKIKKSGCYNLFIGLESGCDRTLKNMNKGFTTKNAISFFKKLNDAGLFFGVSIIVGYPGETEKDFRESLDFILKNKPLIPKIEQINPYIYYDGTSSPLPDGERERVRGTASKRMETLVTAIKSAGFKYTNAFLGNLLEKYDAAI